MKQPKDHIIFPLDFSSLDEALPFIRSLSSHVGMFKVGLELFVRSGPSVIETVQNAGGADIFLDLKLHDIPATVMRTMRVIAGMEVSLATVHCGESSRMLEAAVEGSGGKVGVLGVTVLTSVSGDDIRSSGFQDRFAADVEELVFKRAEMARRAGCRGVVCSGMEAGRIKKNMPEEFIAVTPGIRPLFGEDRKDDQKRVMTPAEAVRNGSDYLVIGRPIRDAEDPVTAVQAIAKEIESALS